MAYFRSWGGYGGGYRRYRRRSYAPRRSYRRSYSYGYSAPPRRRRRKSTTTKKRVASGGAGAMVTRSGSKYILAQADPFDENVEGVKIPDANSQPSVAIKCDDSWSLATGATYTCTAMAFNPSVTRMTVPGTATSNTAWSWPATFGGSSASSKNGRIISECELARPVAHGIRITSGLAPTTATGFLHVCVYAQSVYGQSTWAYPTSLTDLANVPGYKRIPIARLTAEGLTVVNRPLDCTSQRYVDTDDPGYATGQTGEFDVPYQWGCIVIALEGVPVSTSALAIESVLHLECIPRATSVITATPAASYSPGALGGASAAASKTAATYLDQDALKRKAEAIGNAKVGVLKTTGRAGPSLAYRQNYKVKGARTTTIHKKVGLPGVSDRSLPSSRSDVSMTDVSS